MVWRRWSRARRRRRQVGEKPAAWTAPHRPNQWAPRREQVRTDLRLAAREAPPPCAAVCPCLPLWLGVWCARGKCCAAAVVRCLTGAGAALHITDANLEHFLGGDMAKLVRSAYS